MNITKSIAHNRANNFYRWVQTQDTPNGTKYTVSSAGQYRAQLRNFEHKLAPHALEGTHVPADLFELNSANELKAVFAVIKTLPGYGDFIAGNHGNFKAALDLYGRFLGVNACH